MIVPLWINPFAPSETSFQKTHQLIPKKTWRRKKKQPQDALENRISMGVGTYRGLIAFWNWRRGGAAAHLEDVEIVEAERKSPPSDYGK